MGWAYIVQCHGCKKEQLLDASNETAADKEATALGWDVTRVEVTDLFGDRIPEADHTSAYCPKCVERFNAMADLTGPTQMM